MGNDERAYHIEGQVMKPNEALFELSKLYEDRNKQYGNSYKDFGYIMVALFPSGVALKDEMDFNRFGVLVHMVTKMSRYCNKWEHPENQDHMNDIAVYATMLNELDWNIQQ